jgi:hypothetical protein
VDINPIRFADFAKMASEQFVEKNEPLDATIAKIAEKNNLSPTQIQRVVHREDSVGDGCAVLPTSGG